MKEAWKVSAVAPILVTVKAIISEAPAAVSPIDIGKRVASEMPSTVFVELAVPDISFVPPKAGSIVVALPPVVADALLDCMRELCPTSAHTGDAPVKTKVGFSHKAHSYTAVDVHTIEKLVGIKFTNPIPALWRNIIIGQTSVVTGVAYVTLLMPCSCPVSVVPPSVDTEEAMTCIVDAGAVADVAAMRYLIGRSDTPKLGRFSMFAVWKSWAPQNLPLITKPVRILPVGHSKSMNIVWHLVQSIVTPDGPVPSKGS